jgi:hypothetical protein
MLVFCRSSDSITREEIAEEIENGVFFENTPLFDPPTGSEESRAQQWEDMSVRYADDRRPVVIGRSGPFPGIDEEIEEDFAGRKLDTALLRRIVEAKQVFSLDVSKESLTEEAWEMCDFVERFLAERLDGLVYAPGDGIFDANLQPLVRLGAAS